MLIGHKYFGAYSDIQKFLNTVFRTEYTANMAHSHLLNKFKSDLEYADIVYAALSSKFVTNRGLCTLDDALKKFVLRRQWNMSHYFI